MGMYTGVRAKVHVKEEFLDIVDQLCQGSEWLELETDNPEIQMLINKWCTVGRHNFIPNGSLSYMPWEDNDPEWGVRRLDGNLWTFQCSLKDYEGEIEFFFNSILCYMIEDIEHLEEFYEEWNEPQMYKLENGKIKELLK